MTTDIKIHPLIAEYSSCSMPRSLSKRASHGLKIAQLYSIQCDYEITPGDESLEDTLKKTIETFRS